MTAPLVPQPLAAVTLARFDEGRRTALATIGGSLIPAAHGMPSAADVIGDTRLRFVLTARPDLADGLAQALRPELGDDPAARLATLERDEPASHGALIATIVFAYYTDKGVRDALGYPGQQAKQLYSWRLPEYIEEGLIDQVLAKGAVWRDPATGVRSTATYAPVARTEEIP
jgi:hypothetical protein